jgi:hypothetical protein
MSKTLGLDKLKEHLAYTCNTGYILGEKPISTFIIADPERAKSTETIKVKNKGVVIFNDLTAWGIANYIKKLPENECRQFHHAIIPDLERINARSRTVRTEILAQLHILMQEGLIHITTKNTQINFDPPYNIGIIAVTTPEDVGSRNNVFRRASFISCFIPFSFDYSLNLKLNVLKFISSDEHHTKDFIQIPHKKRKIDIELPESFKNELDKYAMDTAHSIDLFTAKSKKKDVYDEQTKQYHIIYTYDTKQHLYGARAKEQYQTYLKSIAYTQKSNIVNDSHFDIFKNIYPYFNFDLIEIDKVNFDGNNFELKEEIKKEIKEEKETKKHFWQRDEQL